MSRRLVCATFLLLFLRFWIGGEGGAKAFLFHLLFSSGARGCCGTVVNAKSAPTSRAYSSTKKRVFFVFVFYNFYISRSGRESLEGHFGSSDYFCRVDVKP